MSTKDERKGFAYLIEGLQCLAKEDLNQDLELLIVGDANKTDFEDIPIKIHLLGLIKDKKRIVDAYTAADVFVIPSLEDNLPNTIMESLSCGTPIVGFETGGIPEMIDHKENGYVSEFKNSTDLANGIKWVLQHEEPDTLRLNARKKGRNSYSFKSVAEQYSSLYNSLR